MTPDFANEFTPVHQQGGSLTHPHSSALLQMLQTTILHPISKGGVLPTQTLVHDSKSYNRLFSCPLARGESYSLKLWCITLNVANYFSPACQQGGSLTHPNSNAWLQMLQTTFLRPISKGGVLSTQTLVHDSRCCKSRFTCPSASRESYSSKLQCMTLDVANHFTPADHQGRSLTHQNSSA